MSRPRPGWTLQETCLGANYTDAQLAFFRAISSYQARYRVRHLRADEVLYVARMCGYRLVAEPTPLPKGR